MILWPICRRIIFLRNEMKAKSTYALINIVRFNGNAHNLRVITLLTISTVLKFRRVLSDLLPLWSFFYVKQSMYFLLLIGFFSLFNTFSARVTSTKFYFTT
uniref:Uncharacterized protein n=1 Tax=Cacopsylla melanoneura TaxID=428564 RepID=A0A8D9EQ77_9HEMI